MFAGFNLPIDRKSFDYLIRKDELSFEEYQDIGEKQIDLHKTKCKDNLKNYILNGVSDGTKIESDWFPQINANIFISHSHKDKDLVMALAGWLSKVFNITCFIDSCVWGYVDDLLEMINSEFSNKRNDENGGLLYSHEKCNIASSHVNVMLCMALQKTVDKTEAVFVVNTKNSIDKYEDVYDTATFSPWIYSEIVCTQIVRNKELSKYRPKEIIKYFTESYTEVNSAYQSAYKVSLDHLVSIDTMNLEHWQVKWGNIVDKNTRFALDELYKIVCPNKMGGLINLQESR